MKDESEVLTVSICIVNYFSSELIEKLIQSIEHYIDPRIRFEVILVNNSINDKAFQELPIKFQKSDCLIKTIEMNENAGFSKANNVAFEHVSGKYVLFCNPDIYMIEDSISAAIECLEGRDDIAALTVKFLYPDKRAQPSGFSKDVGFKIYINNLPFIHKIVEFVSGGKTRSKVMPNDNIMDVDVLCGGFIFMKSSIYQHVSGFDEEFFLYGEDWEISSRLRKVGKLVVLNSTEVIHEHGGSSKNEFHEDGNSLNIWSRKGVQTYVSLSLWQKKEFGELRLFILIILNIIEYFLHAFCVILSVRKMSSDQMKSVSKSFLILLKNQFQMLLGVRKRYRTM